jgi:hypothetical protein
MPAENEDGVVENQETQLGPDDERPDRDVQEPAERQPDVGVVALPAAGCG